MPLRSPKMYFCIFGFQRLVWWPKCTPASRSSFMVKLAIGVLSFGSPPIPSGGTPRAPPAGAGDRISRSCVVMLRSGRVLRVDTNVLLGEVRCPHPVLAGADPEVDGDRVGGAPHDLANALEPGVGSLHALRHQRLAVDGD